MKWFNNKKRPEIRQDIKTSLYTGFEKIFRFMQEKWVKWMIRFTARLSKKALISALLLFVFAAGSYSLFLIVSSFSIQRSNPVYSVTPISKPANSRKNDEQRTKSMRISDSEYHKLKKFRYYMDSLSRSPTGKAIYDSIVSRHPGMLDSLSVVEKYYESQTQFE